MTHTRKLTKFGGETTERKSYIVEEGETVMRQLLGV